MRPAATVQLRAFVGADADGGYAFAEVSASPGCESSGRLARVDGRGRLLEKQPLPAGLVEAALRRTAERRDEPVRVGDEVLGSVAPEGAPGEPARLLPAPASGPARWRLEPVPGAPAILRLDGLSPRDAELKATLRLAEGGGHEIVLRRIPKIGRTWVSGVLLLPRGRRALLSAGFVSARGRSLYRLEALSGLEVGSGLAALLDARAVERLRRGELVAAREDLRRAVAAAPWDAVAHYNLACALALLGAEDEALFALGTAIDLEPRLKREALADPDLESLRDRVEFKLMAEPRRGE
jgi:hypothetical protein